MNNSESNSSSMNQQNLESKKNILYKDRDYSRLAKARDGKSNIDNISIKYSSKRVVRKGVVPNLVGLDKNSAFKLLESIDAKYDHNGFGIVKEQYPSPGTKISTNMIIKLKFKAPSYDE